MLWILLCFRVLLLHAGPVPVIVDTDMGGGACHDVDDVGALCLLNTLADAGEAKLAAVVVDTSPKHGVGVVSVLNHYYGRDDVPIGSYKGDGLTPDAPFSDYTRELVQKFASPIKDSSQTPNSVDVYRQALAAEADHSVVINSIGLLTNLADLLKSKSDQHSTLNGYDLVAKKVKLLAMMGGKYPKASSAECNFCGALQGADAVSAATAQAATEYVLSHIPPEVPVVFLGEEVGDAVHSGAALETCAPEANPCRAAYMNWKARHSDGGWQPGGGRASFDLLTILISVRGIDSVPGVNYCDECDGMNTVDGNGFNTWKSGPASNQKYVVLANSKIAGAQLDQLLCKTPAAKASNAPDLLQTGAEAKASQIPITTEVGISGFPPYAGYSVGFQQGTQSEFGSNVWTSMRHGNQLEQLYSSQQPYYYGYGYPYYPGYPTQNYGYPFMPNIGTAPWWGAYGTPWTAAGWGYWGMPGFPSAMYA